MAAQQSSYRVTKEYDENGQLIRYDSVRTSSNGHYYSFRNSGSLPLTVAKGAAMQIFTDSLAYEIDSVIQLNLGGTVMKPHIFIQNWEDTDSLRLQIHHIDSLMQCKMKAMFKDMDAVFRSCDKKEAK